MSYYSEEKKQQRKEQKLNDQQQAKLELAVRGLLAEEHGRAYLFWLLEIGKAIGHNPATGNALTTHFGCGEMNVGQQIMGHIISVDPAGFMRVLEEQGNDGRSDDDAGNGTGDEAGDD